MAEIDIIIGADVSKATRELAILKGKLREMQSGIDLTKEVIGDFNQSIKRNEKEIAGLTKQLSNMTLTSKAAIKTAQGLKEKITQLNSANTTLSNNIKITTKELDLEKAAMTDMAKQVKAAEIAGGGFSKGLNTIWGGLKKISYILPGLGIAGLIGLLTGPLIAGFSLLAEKIFGANKQLYDMSEFTKAFTEDAAKEKTELYLLKNAIEDEGLSREVRLQAIKDLKKEFPGLFDGLTNEQLLTGNVAGAYDLATKAIIRKAKASAAAGEIEKIEKQKLLVLQKSEEDALKTNQLLRDAKPRTTTTGGGFEVSLKEVRRGILESYNLRKKGVQDEIDLLNKKESWFLDIANEGFEDRLKAEIAAAKAAEEARKKSHTATIKDVRDINDVLNELALKTKELSAEEDFLGIDKSKEKISAIQSALKELVVKFKVDPKDTVIQKLLGDIKDLTPGKYVDLFFAILPTSEQIKKEAERIAKEFNDSLGKYKMKSKLEIQGGIGHSDKKSKYQEDAEKEAAAVEKTWEGHIENLNSIINTTLSDSVSTFAEGIADAISGTGSIGDVFGNVFKIIGSGLQSMGKAMIAYGFGISALKEAIKNPYLAIAAGVGLVILGKLMQNSIPQFADGVTNFGGGMAVVGERGPELVRLPKGSDVIPNGRVNGMSPMGAQVFIPAITLRGNDLVMAFNRASQTISRTG